jgi:F0F1-type ATP synthase assembly protein I
MSHPENSSKDRFNTILATVVGQVGCLTPVILLGALFAGLWLDRQFETKPLFTILFIVGSAPVSVFVLYRIVRSATAKLKTENQVENSEEEANRE